ncbi:hypothetical protein [Streptomyces sp. ST2-7A]|uniref:hypothetical protein n=1 Tax=Streptomyces sp. ST2-7A TaxID=2907214 RepID=UPI001F19A637|nr:hypothetical protein [Streptomyces sp. ST2-7A]MCE7081138.1 hypothetical protein [Streptomyces sp. ST2-7A]
MQTSIVVVYGSAADPTVTHPGDIDVAHTGPRETAEPLVAEWARTHGREGLPIDWHPAHPTHDNLTLPTPCNTPGHATILSGDVTITWQPLTGLTSQIRAHGHHPKHLRTRLTAPGPPWRLAALPGPRDTGRWDDYIEGLTALRSAVAKRPPARAVLLDLWGPLLGRLLDQDPTPDPDALAELTAASPAAADGAVVLAFHPGGTIGQPYGHLTGPDLAHRLYP